MSNQIFNSFDYKPSGIYTEIIPGSAAPESILCEIARQAHIAIMKKYSQENFSPPADDFYNQFISANELKMNEVDGLPAKVMVINDSGRFFFCANLYDSHHELMSHTRLLESAARSLDQKAL
jgi:hypothetical protein